MSYPAREEGLVNKTWFLFVFVTLTNIKPRDEFIQTFNKLRFLKFFTIFTSNTICAIFLFAFYLNIDLFLSFFLSFSLSLSLSLYIYIYIFMYKGKTVNKSDCMKMYKDEKTQCFRKADFINRIIYQCWMFRLFEIHQGVWVSKWKEKHDSISIDCLFQIHVT